MEPETQPEEVTPVVTIDPSKRIIFRQDGGGVSVIIPCDCGLTIEEIAAKDVPVGAPWRIVDVSAIPSDRTFRSAWEWVD